MQPSHTLPHLAGSNSRRWPSFMALLLLAVGVSSTAAMAAPLNLSRVPPLINARVPPNVLISLDDSGSMAFGFTPDAIETNVPTQANGRARHCFYQLARHYSPVYNHQYFDPDFEYPPPIDANGDPMPNSNFTSAWRNGYNHGQGTVNLSSQYFVTFWDGLGSNRDNIHHNASNGQSGTGINRMGNHSQCNTMAPESVRNVQNKRAYFPFGARAFYYRWNGVDNPSPTQLLDNTSFTPVNVATQSQEIRQRFANWFSYYRMRGHTAKLALSHAFDRIEDNTRVAWQNLNASQLVASSTIGPLVGNRRNQFYNWMFNSPYSGGTPLRQTMIRAGQFFERSGSTPRNPYWDEGYGREMSCRQNFHVMVTDGYWNENNPTGLPATTIGNADRTATVLPDGKPFAVGASESRVYWNEQLPQSGCNGPTNDSFGPDQCVPSLADISFYYWSRDLKPNLPNNVPRYRSDMSTGIIPGANAELEVFHNPANNPATWQHMTNFIVGFGVVGTLDYDNDPSSPVMTQAERMLRLRRGEDRWPMVRNNHPSSIDDAWHAALNSRGLYLSASNPQSLVDALVGLIDHVNQRIGSVGSAGSTSFLRSGATLYEVSYDSGSWNGTVTAYLLDPEDGSRLRPAWSADAGVQMSQVGHGARVVLTNRAEPGEPAIGAPFRWNSLPATYREMLNTDPITNVNDGRGSQRIDYLRGDRSQEQSQIGPGGFRNREGVMGAYINSSAIYVGAPAAGYDDAGAAFAEGADYIQFRQDNLSRGQDGATLYAGSNDGMMHAINANTGATRWSFVPGTVIPNLTRLTTPQFQFVPFVNNTPIVQDVYIDGSWRTVLLGALGLGGQGVFALDITSPDKTEGEATTTVLWEFSDAVEGAERLGYTFGRPNVARLHDGRWVALIPGGYNNESTTNDSTSGMVNQRQDDYVGDGRAVLFMLNIADGSIIETFVLPPDAYGLASVVVGDYEGDFIDDFAVAGDLSGNLWRFDLREGKWGVRRLFRPATAGERPITATPRIFPDPVSGKMMIVVGTGKFIEEDDREITTPRQAIIGVRDPRDDADAYPIRENQLVTQTLSQITNDGEILMDQTNSVPAAAGGWRVLLGDTDLSNALQGERVIEMGTAFFSEGIIGIRSFIPSSEPCLPLGSGVLYLLSASTGGFAIPGQDTGEEVLPEGSVFGGSELAVGRLFDSMSPGAGPVLSCPGGSCSIMPDLGVTIPSSVWRRRGWRPIDLPDVN